MEVEDDDQVEWESLESFVNDKLWNSPRGWIFSDLFNLIKVHIPGEEESRGLDEIKKRLDDNLYSTKEECFDDLTLMYNKFIKYKRFLKRQVKLSEVAELQVEFYKTCIFGNAKPPVSKPKAIEPAILTVLDVKPSYSGQKSIGQLGIPTPTASSSKPVPPQLSRNPEVYVKSRTFLPVAVPQPRTGNKTVMTVEPEDSRLKDFLPQPTKVKDSFEVDEDKRHKPLSLREKIQLSHDVNTLRPELLGKVVEIIRTTDPAFLNSTEKDFEVNFGALQTYTLRKLQVYLDSCREAEKDGRNGEGSKSGMKRELEKFLLQDSEVTSGQATKFTSSRKGGKTGRGKGCGCGK